MPRRTLKARRAKRPASRKQRGGSYLATWFQSFWPPEDIISADVKNFKKVVDELIDDTVVKIKEVLRGGHETFLERRELHNDFRELIRLLKHKIAEINQMIDENPDDRDDLLDIKTDINNLLYTERDYGFRRPEHGNHRTSFSLVGLTVELKIPEREMRKRSGTNRSKFKVWA